MEYDMSMQQLKHKYREVFSNKYWVKSTLWAIVLFIIALFINYYAALYAADSASNYVNDIILSNIPVVDVDLIFVFGPLIFWGVLAAYNLLDPKKIPFGLKALAVFIITRSIFITLTHIGPYPDHIALGIHTMLMNRWNLGNLLTFGSGGDLFFSGHTGLPFLAALVFWNDRRMRNFCLASAFIFGAVVLLGHLHYSIDVLSAFFITFTIYHICEYLFKKDRKLFFGEVIHI